MTATIPPRTQSPVPALRGVIVGIDGPAGAGKSSVSRTVAARAGLAFVDTGAIYRTLALSAARAGVSFDDAEALAGLAAAMPIAFQNAADGQRVLLGTEDVSTAIRTEAVSDGASRVSRHAPVRTALLDLQRKLGRAAGGVGGMDSNGQPGQHGGRGALLEGRDIGTVVFPDADLKVFLTASAEVRARRRTDQLLERGEAADYAQILADVVARDARDSGRAVAPLKPADDATIVDSSNMDFEAVVAHIVALVEAAEARIVAQAARHPEA